MDRIVSHLITLLQASSLQAQPNYEYDGQGRLIADLDEGIAFMKTQKVELELLSLVGI